MSTSRLFAVGIAAVCTMLTRVAFADTVQAVTYPSGQTQTVGGSSITLLNTSGAVVVASGANITFQANTRIQLLPGFKVAANGRFHAQIVTAQGGKADQPGVASLNASILPGVPWTPVYIGGAGGGAWQFSVSSPLQTNWPTDASSGTFDRSTSSITTVWLPPRTGIYSFYVRKLGDANYNDSPTAGPYTLIVSNAVVEDPDDRDDNNNGIPDEVERELGLDPNNIHFLEYEYDKVNQLKKGPGGSYIIDAEGNIKGVRN